VSAASTSALTAHPGENPGPELVDDERPASALFPRHFAPTVPAGPGSAHRPEAGPRGCAVRRALPLPADEDRAVRA
jgi:hypothetical protein